MDELLEALEDFNESEVRRLLENGHNPNFRGYAGITPLHLAVDIEIQDAINRYDKYNDTTRPNGNLVRLLLYYGADIEAKDDQGATPLDWANNMEYIEAVEIINYFKSKKAE